MRIRTELALPFVGHDTSAKPKPSDSGSQEKGELLGSLVTVGGLAAGKNLTQQVSSESAK